MRVVRRQRGTLALLTRGNLVPPVRLHAGDYSVVLVGPVYRKPLDRRRRLGWLLLPRAPGGWLAWSFAARLDSLARLWVATRTFAAALGVVVGEAVSSAPHTTTSLAYKTRNVQQQQQQRPIPAPPAKPPRHHHHRRHCNLRRSSTM